MTAAPCPHCGSTDVARGATGLDECNACGGLSRDGRALHAVAPATERAAFLSGHLLARLTSRDNGLVVDDAVVDHDDEGIVTGRFTVTCLGKRMSVTVEELP